MKEEPGRHVALMTDATIAAVDSLMPSDWRVMGGMIYMNLDNTFSEK